MKKLFSAVCLLGFSLFISREIVLGESFVQVSNEEQDSSALIADVETQTAQVSKKMTANEILAYFVEENHVSVQEAARDLNISKKERASATFRTLCSSFTVCGTYHPEVRFYVETSESGVYHGIKKIKNIQLRRNVIGKTKQFGGNLYFNLENANRIYYVVNGDFYNNGTTTYNASVNVGLGQHANVKFGVSYSTNHFSGCYVEKRLRW